jgi:hypothetical protein
MTWGEFKRAVEAEGIKDDDMVEEVDLRYDMGDYPADVEIGIWRNRNSPSGRSITIKGKD